MARVPGLLLLGLSLSACARPTVEPRPAPAPSRAATPRSPVRSDSAATSRATADGSVRSTNAAPVPHDSAGRARAIVDASRDSLADAKALNALSESSALNNLPELPIGEEPSLELNEAAFSDQPRVQFYIDYFSGLAHDRFQVWLDRLPRYESLIRGRMADNKMPGDMIYLALIESGYSPTAVSSASAVGMWQFMVGTGAKYGLRVDAWLDERRDPVKSTNAAARHLRDLTDMFGSYYLAAAAYNAGAGKVGRGLTRLTGSATQNPADEEADPTSGEAFFSLANTRLLMQETKDYVPKLIAATLIAKDPQKYGFERVTGVEPFTLDSVMVDGGTGLDLIARLADTTLDAMRELNPNLLRLVAPPGMASYPIRVPAGTAVSVAAQYAEIPVDERPALVMHTVRAGETVVSIAASTGVSASDIRTVNRAARAANVTPGTILYLPYTTIPLSLLRDAGSSTLLTTHIVRSGENLGGIARKYGVSVASVRSSNGLSSKSLIRVGQKLNIPLSITPGLASTAPLPVGDSAPKSSPAVRRAPTSSAATKPATSATGTTLTHVVRAGETLSGIAALYGANQARLVLINGLGASRKIVVGQKLKIPA